MQQEQISLDSWSGKTCPEHSQAQTEKISEPSSKKPRELPTPQYQFLDLRTGGAILGAFWDTGLAYHGARLTHNTGEYPNVVVESTLSQILEDNPHPKYFLSNRAVIGILRRANNRGKELPQMLKSALINQARECNYGEEEITNTGKILRNLWEEVGEEGFENWIRRAFILVQSEEILLSVLLEQSQQSSEDGKSVKTTGKEVGSKVALSNMWKEWENSRSPYRQKPNEQLVGELNNALLQLSRQTAPAEIFMHCLRIACQGSQPMQQTLASMEKVKSEGLGYGIYKVNKGSSEAMPLCSDNYKEPQVAICLQGNGIDRADTAGCNGKRWKEDICYTLNTIDRPAVATFRKSARAQSEDGYETWVEDDKTNTVNTFKVKSKGPCAVYSMQRSDEYVAADVASTESARQYKSATDLVTHTNAVRRITPLECERLQGYPDNYTNIPGASDSARYKALGNSFAIPNALFSIKGCVEKLKDGI